MFSPLFFIFQFTTSQGGRLRGERMLCKKLNFQFTTSQGGRPGAIRALLFFGGLSIHDLTRRSTGEDPETILKNYLSIHDLTRRSTIFKNQYCVGFFFQFTTSQGGRQIILEPHNFEQSFNSRPHKEVDCPGRLLLPERCTFNSRPHKEVDIIPGATASRQDIFQFTTSQGGRRKKRKA